jgi:hypothetical protein
MINGMARQLVGGTGHLQLPALWELLVPQNCLGGDFNGVYFVANRAPTLSKWM